MKANEFFAIATRQLRSEVKAKILIDACMEAATETTLPVKPLLQMFLKASVDREVWKVSDDAYELSLKAIMYRAKMFHNALAANGLSLFDVPR